MACEMSKFFSLAIFLIGLTLSGCQDDPPSTVERVEKKSTTAPDIKTQQQSSSPVNTEQRAGKTILFDEPIEPIVVELPSEAIPFWREVTTTAKPALILFSIHPLIQPVDQSLKTSVSNLMTKGTKEDFVHHGSRYRSDPIILPTQSVSAAISAGVFSEIIWVFPSTAPVDQMQLDLFSKQVTKADFLTQTEAQALTLKEGIFSGTVRGLPFRAVHPEALPKINKPMILHVDLGYFKGLYQGEVKTRIYDLLQKTALALYDTGWAPELTTLSYSTMEGTFSLDVRFLITNFAEMLRKPTLLDGTIPQNWALRSEALYAANFFLDEKVQEYYKQAAENYPREASAQYDLYKHMFFEQHKVDDALAILDKAVTLDRGYVAAYLELAEIANNDGNLTVALELLSKAAPLVPENVMVNLYRAQFMIQHGEKAQAIPLIKQLKGMQWSNYYHGGIPQLLDEMLNAPVKGSEQNTTTDDNARDIAPTD
jgi:hypothetical protein